MRERETETDRDRQRQTERQRKNGMNGGKMLHVRQRMNLKKGGRGRQEGKNKKKRTDK